MQEENLVGQKRAREDSQELSEKQVRSEEALEEEVEQK
jgi:hypothetical protein